MFKQYQRKPSFCEAERVAETTSLQDLIDAEISISEADKNEFESVERGYIVCNIDNYNDMWYVSLKFFNDNYIV